MYLGRIIVVGSTREEQPCCAYAVSGRSRSSKARKAVVYDKKITIEPLEQVSEEQRYQASLIFYDCIISREDLPLVVIGNGRQVNPISSISSSEDIPIMMSRVLKEFGPEPDRYSTPRIVGTLKKYSINGEWVSYVGMITSDNIDVKSIEIKRNKLIYLGTYTGEGVEPRAPQLTDLKKILKNIELEGDTAKDLADSFFDWIDPNFIVCTASAVWMGDSWELAVKNR
ncbi:MAG: hypothetical protein L6M37_04350 [Candidatus Methylarchaceae archaeon HK02M1]|nr:hypothetical protein [Candidatus Methylarchaceae archaeon HK02M1]